MAPGSNEVFNVVLRRKCLSTPAIHDKQTLVRYLFEYNAQNFIAKTPMQSSVRVINEVLHFCAFTSEDTEFKSNARERASTVYFI